MNRARFVLSTDISEFYASVYTHSLSWALEEKDTAKARLAARRRLTKQERLAQETVGDRLDKAITAAQEGQTKGIPIGPDTSFLASEIVLCAVDVKVEQKIPEFARRATRWSDDLQYFASSRAEAEQALLLWESELARYELTLNPAKTSIVEAPLPLGPSWLSTLSRHRIRRTSDAATANDMADFFSLAFDLRRQFPTEPVVSYAIRRFQSWDFSRKTWRRFARLLLPALTIEPSALSYAAQALVRARTLGLKVEFRNVSETLEDLIVYHAPLADSFTVLWSLSILAEAGRQIDERTATAVAKMEDNCCLIMLLHLRDRGLVPRAIADPPVLNRASSPDGLESSDWLLAYEAARLGWISNAAAAKHRHFRQLLVKKVAFFNPRLRTRFKGQATSKKVTMDAQEDLTLDYR